jgi:ectoine hydroxylase-related dioxygenase (phytanoyl-CoA dioxygenase family)
LKLPNFVIQKLKLNEVLEPILSKLRTIMGTPLPQIRTHNVVFVPVGSKAQQWHMDDSMQQRKVHRYFTILIQLNTIDSECGGTEVWIDKYKKGDLIRCRPGDALVFHGSLLHRGQANNGNCHRYFYYASFACGSDLNVGGLM